MAMGTWDTGGKHAVIHIQCCYLIILLFWERIFLKQQSNSNSVSLYKNLNMDYLSSLEHKELVELSEAMDSSASSLRDESIKLQKMLDHIVRCDYSTSLVDQAKEILRTIKGAELDKENLLADILELKESSDFENLKAAVCSLVTERTGRNSKCNLM
ncbi:uncharacterized protein LOC118458794 [Anopheles albimanus]|uniref:uncharacterized protein LOC118458794 n=1 Tax=Anopheles albimanus TaxID=7167 RepID=UPI0016402AF3|nr:uncharacterized protein LOC118458794 [Anopheles albimanus]